MGWRRHLLHSHGHACVGTGAHAPCLPQPYPVRFTSMVRLPLYGHIYMARLFLHGHGHSNLINDSNNLSDSFWTKPGFYEGFSRHERQLLGSVVRIFNPITSHIPMARFHGHMPSLRSSRFRAHSRRDQRPVHSNAHPTNSHKFTAPTRGAWASGYGIASRCGDAATTATSTSGGPMPVYASGIQKGGRVL